MEHKRWLKECIALLEQGNFRQVDDMLTAILFETMKSAASYLMLTVDDLLVPQAKHLAVAIDLLGEHAFGFSTAHSHLSKRDPSMGFLCHGKASATEPVDLQSPPDGRFNFEAQRMRSDSQNSNQQSQMISELSNDAIKQADSASTFTARSLPSASRISNSFSDGRGKIRHKSLASPVAMPKRVANVVIIDLTSLAPGTPSAKQALSDIHKIVLAGQVTENGQIFPFPKHFCCILLQSATQSTQSTEIIPRFMLDHVSYQLYMSDGNWPVCPKDLAPQQPLISAQELDRLSIVIQNDVYVSPMVAKYLRDLTRSFRRNANLFMGISPRASMDIAHASRISALLLFECQFVLPEHIAFILPRVLQHRIRPKSQHNHRQSTSSMAFPDSEAYQLIVEVLETTAMLL